MTAENLYVVTENLKKTCKMYIKFYFSYDQQIS